MKFWVKTFAFSSRSDQAGARLQHGLRGAYPSAFPTETATRYLSTLGRATERRHVAPAPARNMVSSSPRPPPSTAWPRPPPVAVARPNPTISSSSCFSTLSPRGAVSLCSASRAFSVSFRQRQASHLGGRSRLPIPIRCFQGSGEVDAVNIEETKQPQGGSTGPRSYGKELLKSFSAKELLEKLKRYGAAGVLSYGLLNTVYYVTTFLLVWFYFSPAPGKMGYAAAVERFLKLMVMVWAGSQVTKILRAGGAIALAPFVDRGLRWFTVKFNFQSERKAFVTIVGLCFGLAAVLFFGLTILWA